MATRKEKNQPSSKPNPDEPKSLARISGITFEVLSLNLIIIGLGYYIDQWTGASPWALIVSVFVATGATIFYLLKRFSS